MNTREIALEVTELIRERKNKIAKEKFYASDIISIEGNGDKAEGLDAVQAKSTAWTEQIAEFHSSNVSDPIIAADHFAVNMQFDITYKNGYRSVMDEIAVYQVKDGKIVFEQFFYNA